MLNLKKIAITGGFASGKSTVCKIFKDLGAYVVSSDEITHELLSIDSDLGREIIRLLKLNTPKSNQHFRKIIAEKVFKDPNQLKSLEKILHPKILQKIEERYQKACDEKKGGCFIVEMPLLFEIQNEGFYDAVVTVLTDETIARDRLKKAGISPTEYDLRMQHQFPPHVKAARADHVIENNGSIKELEHQVKTIYQNYQTT